MSYSRHAGSPREPDEALVAASATGRYQHVDDLVLGADDSMRRKRGRTGDQAPFPGVQQRCELTLRSRRAARRREVHAGKQDLPGPAVSETVPKRAVAKAAFASLDSGQQPVLPPQQRIESVPIE